MNENSHSSRIKSIKALTFGEALFDIIKGSAHLGGAPLNLAAHLAKLGAKPAVITAVGRDELGKSLFTRAEAMGIDTSYILIDKKRPTGTVTVQLQAEGIPVFTINRGVAWDSITPGEKEFEALSREEWDVFCFGTLAQRSEENRKTLKRLFSEIKAKYFFYDVNLRTGNYKEEWILSSLKYTTILKLNEEEAASISCMLSGTPGTCKPLTSYKAFCLLATEKYPEISVICISRGPRGAAVFHKGIYEEVETTPVEVADTVGAGDAFSAGFLYTYLSGYGVSKAASIACILGTYVASKPGAVPDYSKELIEELKTQGLKLSLIKN
ncbi:MULTISPECIES: carbohydrate kinase family protein [Methanosarcina]|uniref:Fructokinase n=3 Tax=Methanosarcina barkeri TaxID=2208 RepID=A0A0E3QTP3_METBA|nr:MULTISPECIES: carbohydrate kinase [Methanosarcina]AKB54758.1 Fructokinase [Methanosarcina barkeri MS]AKB57161.1 Fructokinase [Methanosarcina barkeri 227]AKJ37724.1 PfkB family carbohydrate kinase [Methanosarcina barkeri CM1]OED06815.1 fructokinase [Methanosarcina sp. A14]